MFDLKASVKNKIGYIKLHSTVSKVRIGKKGEVLPGDPTALEETNNNNKGQIAVKVRPIKKLVDIRQVDSNVLHEVANASVEDLRQA